MLEESKICSAIIMLQGIVQGVGFRPFIHRLAKGHRLNGYILNTSTGVKIEVEGSKFDVTSFYGAIEKHAPPFAQIQGKTISFKKPEGFKEFEIRGSVTEDETLALISPDLSICDECVEELFDPSNRRYLYPFINCTNCGPRFTIIREIPYDRPNTSMQHFNMCEKCLEEYNNINDRRYHAQPNACWQCGPQIGLMSLSRGVDSSYNHTDERAGTGGRDALFAAVELLKFGQVVAVKGIGGFHLACDAENDAAVLTLKNRKKREKDKPLAVMFPCIETVKEFCIVSEQEFDLLKSHQKPIVLVQKKPNSWISPHISPDNKYLGVMLPYTPLHYLLFYSKSRFHSISNQEALPFRSLVMTSANPSDEPIVKDNDEAYLRLHDIADHILLHDRPILRPCDDSVLRVNNNAVSFIRRSRGYTPFPVVLDFELNETVACGAELKNTFCVTKHNYAFLSQHIGDLQNWETYQYFKECLSHFMTQFQIQPKFIACDMHPDYLSTSLANELVAELAAGGAERIFKIQHHHAHVASCMAENGLNEKVIGIAFDGTGFGLDSKIWGCEFLVCDYRDMIRVGHLDYLPLPGGDSSIKEPWKIAVSYLFNVFGETILKKNFGFLHNLQTKKLEILIEILQKRVNVIDTSSLGRLFDAVSALVLSVNTVTYEGQGAFMLENSMDKKVDECYSYSIQKNGGVFIIDPRPIITEIVYDILNHAEPCIISSKFHNSVVNFTIDLCKKLYKETGIDKIVLSGGCFQNRFLSENIYNMLKVQKFNCYTHTKVPANDGGISLGQALIASERSKYVRGNSG